MANLTTRGKFKRYAGIPAGSTGDDALIDALITAGTKRIEHLCARIFKADDYHHWLDRNDTILKVRNFPIIRIDRVMTGECGGIDLEYTGTDILAQVTVFGDETFQTVGIRLQSTSAAGTSINTEKTFAAFPTLSAMAAELNTVADWTVSQIGLDWPSADLHPLSNLDALARKVQLTRPGQHFQYSPNYRTGILEIEHLGDRTFFMEQNPYDRPLRRHQRILVVYRGGLDTIPADVEQMSHEYINVMLAGAANTGQVKSENLGDYSYSLANATEINDTQMQILRPYMEIR